MNKAVLFLLLAFLPLHNALAQCNPDLNIGAVIVPTHSNQKNGGNFTSPTGWEESAAWVDSLGLDYRVAYVNWTDVVTNIDKGIPQYDNGSADFQNALTDISHAKVHIVYTNFSVAAANTFAPFPTGFNGFVSFTDTAYINQSYNAIKFILSNYKNVSWISIGNEIDTYFGGVYANSGRISQFSMYLDTLKNRIHRDFPNVSVGTVLAFHNMYRNKNLSVIDSVVNSVDFIGYTFYYTTEGSPNDNCWGDPATVKSWLDTALIHVRSRKMFLTETCMGDGGGIEQNCGSPSKQLAYADTLLNYYQANKNKIAGMTWFTLPDPDMTFLTSSTLWNNSGLIDSSASFVEPAGTVWRHSCLVTGIKEIDSLMISMYPNPAIQEFIIKLGTKNSSADIVMYDRMGIVKNKLQIKDGDSIDISSLTTGIYCVRIKINSQIYSRLLVKN